MAKTINGSQPSLAAAPESGPQAAGVAECQRAYDDLARQCTELARSIPKIRVEIEKRVKAEMGDAEKKLATLMASKRAAFAALEAAIARDKPAREKREADEAAAKAAADRKAKRDANAQRAADNEKKLAKRLAEATA